MVGREGRTAGGAREKCEAYRAGKVASTLLMLRVQRVKLEGPGLHKFSITRGRKVNRNGLRQSEL